MIFTVINIICIVLMGVFIVWVASWGTDLPTDKQEEEES